ncbi:response regulator transcription factor [Fundicoccus sp. Sow4_H7]|uniref:response regulator transcription factor n=1 Tax=Fundicoccus sp. Sow4_H7 TaxID=3438784 RepID=UPI003F92912A
MKHLIIVDDEEAVRQSIVNVIDWEEAGFKLVGDASNGQEALALVEENKIDVVITDIRMPVMDGLELAQHIQIIDPTIKIIILTGFDNIEYAQEAFRWNIHEYLLKPISVDDLYAALQRVTNAIEADRRQATDINHLTQQYMQSLDATRRAYLISLINNAYFSNDEGHLANQAQLYQVRLNGPRYIIINIVLSEEGSLHLNEEVNTYTKDIVFYKEIDWVSYTSSVERIIHRYGQGEVFRYNQSIMVIMNGKESFFEHSLDILLTDIRQSLNKLFNVHTMMGISATTDKLSNLNHLYRQTLNALEYGSTHPEFTQITISDVVTETDYNIQSTDLILEAINRAVKLGQVDDLQLAIDELNELVKTQHFQSSFVFSILLGLIGQLTRLYYETVSAEVNSLFINQQIDYFLASRGKFTEVILETFGGIALNILQEIQNKHDETKETITTQALRMIDEQFQQPDFSQQILADQLFITPNYLSTLFSKETGKTFKDHLIEKRMLTGQEMLLTTNKRIHEIAQAVGYTDQYYFSYSFKKYFGQSPRQMRQFNKK